MKPAFSAEDLKKMKRQELYAIAQKMNIKGRSKLTKAQLIVELEPYAEEKSSEIVPNKIQEAVATEKKSKTVVKAEASVRKNIEKKDEKATPRLGRSFAKKQDVADENAPRKKGAQVKKAKNSSQENKEELTSEASTAETKSFSDSKPSKKYSSLKTTMEIPVFPAPNLSTAITEDQLTGDFPTDYGEARVVLQIRDPHWAHAYWEIPYSELKRLEMEVGIFEYAHSHFILRVHNVSEGHSYDIRLNEYARNWYINLSKAQTVYQVELGLMSPSEGYSFIALSNLVQTPPDVVAENWAAPVSNAANVEHATESYPNRIAGHEVVSGATAQNEQKPEVAELSDPQVVYGIKPSEFRPEQDRIGGHAYKPGTSMPTSVPGIPGVPGSFQEVPSSHLMPSSAGMPTSRPAVPTSPGAVEAPQEGAAPKKEKDFWLVVNTELILYGATEPDANVTVQGIPVKLRPDGTFSLRFALPDGIQELPVHAVNADGDMEEKITPVVTRQTYYGK